MSRVTSLLHVRPKRLLHGLLAILLSFLIASAFAADGLPQASIQSEDLDPVAFTGWSRENSQNEGAVKSGPKAVLWTRNSRPDWRGVAFGESQTPGPRHLCVGLKTPTLVGSVMVRGGGQLSVLRPNATYPGDPTKETDWIAAERLDGGAVTKEEVDREEIALWTLPPGTKTRSLRFTHLAAASDPKYEGWLGGALILPERVANLAPQATVIASERDEAAAKINDGQDNAWKTWDNGKDGGSHTVSADQPETLTLLWPKEVTLNGLESFWTGFGSADIQAFAGTADQHPRDPGATWKTIKSFSGMENGYPLTFWPSAYDFRENVTTRSIRVRITGVTKEGHPHLRGRTAGGKRVWLGELMALHPLGDRDLKTALLPAIPSDAHPPIPITFTLPRPSFVTLVIEDVAGKRVRNLVSETSFPAGENTAWWDGTDDIGRDLDAARHGLYHVPGAPVVPGTYRVRGIFRDALELRYEFSVYNPGNPPWETEDKRGGWLTNHTPPQAAIFVPRGKAPTGQSSVYLGSAVSEGGAGLAWVDLDGKKLGGRGWIGGNWTAAPHLACDSGPKAMPGIYAYVGATWTATADNKDKTHGELRLTALTKDGDLAILKHPFSPKQPENEKEDDQLWIGQLGGIAAYDGIVVATMKHLDQLLFADAHTNSVIEQTTIPSPRGTTFDAKGRLLVLSKNKLLRYDAPLRTPGKPGTPETVVASGLSDPQGLTLDAQGLIYVSDQGTSHQVKVYSPAGKLLRTIGLAGAPKAGLYNPQHMNHPAGLAIDDRQQLWVTENDYQPKRVSVWTLDGKLVRSFYGPGRYGGGGTLDPRDKTRFYYDGIEFKLDWKTGANEPVAIFHRGQEGELDSQFRAGPPETPIYFGGRQYLTNCYNSSPTNGHPVASIWELRDHIAVPVASMGRAKDWPLLRGDDFRACWPASVDPNSDSANNSALFAWSDLDGDGRVQPAEISMIKAESGGVTVMPDLAFVVARVGDRAKRFAPVRFTEKGVPVFDIAAGETVASGTQPPASSGGDQVLVHPDGWTITTVASQPWARESLGGLKDNVPLWSYPSLWPGLHASHEAAVPDRPGEIIGSTRLLGGFITTGAEGSKDREILWCINGNMGNAYLFTADGLFVAQFFQDARVGKPWTMPSAERGALLNDLTLHDENFFPTISQTSDGQVYLCNGSRMSLVRVDGLSSIRRLATMDLKLSAKDLESAATWRLAAEQERQRARGAGTLTVALRQTAPVVDGKLDDWANADWAVIDRRGVAANFNSESKPYDVTAAVTIAGDRLYAAFRTQDAELLKNSVETPNAPFKTGGCLDLMIGASPSADPKRRKPVAGDQRLLITQMKGQPFALIYRAVVPGTKDPVPFSSPWRTITIDQVENVSAHVQLAASIEKTSSGKIKNAFYELSIPLVDLGLTPADGQSIKGDVGILRGNGFQTLQRVYWNNKATGITADVPSEAELSPALWGNWVFKSAP